ncbi:MAG TPA: hypothetical protein VJT83_00035, partial [Chitinophagaceae bacterium]|nr:hypothetical protein [Chitinophagaceae bacterium]
LKQFASSYTIAYDKMLNNMVERRMRQSIYAVASFWYTAWVNAGQPDLKILINKDFSEDDRKNFDSLNIAWQTGKINGRSHELPPP